MEARPKISIAHIASPAKRGVLQKRKGRAKQRAPSHVRERDKELVRSRKILKRDVTQVSTSKDYETLPIVKSRKAKTLSTGACKGSGNTSTESAVRGKVP